MSVLGGAKENRRRILEASDLLERITKQLSQVAATPNFASREGVPQLLRSIHELSQEVLTLAREFER